MPDPIILAKNHQSSHQARGDCYAVLFCLTRKPCVIGGGMHAKSLTYDSVSVVLLYDKRSASVQVTRKQLIMHLIRT